MSEPVTTRTPSLSLLPTENLIEELCSRFDAFVMAGVMIRNMGDGQANAIRSLRHKGDPILCQGLAAGLQHTLAEYELRMEQTLPPESL
jgi:hypothetical protein